MNKIHPTSIIGPNVVLGDNNDIGPYTIIQGNVKLGNGNKISSHVIIGCQATDTKFVKSKAALVEIGDNNIIREFSLIESPCYEEKTVIEDDVYIMQGVHVSHDVLVRSNSVLTNTSVVAGIVKILRGANISMACTINQYTTIGHYSIIATNSACMKNVKPFSRYIPNKPISVNYYAIDKYGFEQYKAEIEKYVLNDIYPTSKLISQIVDEFNYWVEKYGHKTY